MLRKYSLYVMLLVLAGCASTMSPEQKLGRGYDSADASVVSATALIRRDAISTESGKSISTLAKTAKTVLDEGTRKLEECRASIPAQPCDDAVSTIDLGFGVLMNIEQFLEERQQ